MGDLIKKVPVTSQSVVLGSGANCTLSYQAGKVRRSIRLRCIQIAHGFEVIGDESQARLHRAFYPRQVVPAQFSLTFALKARPNLIGHKTVTIKGKKVANVGEYERFNAWMHDYMRLLLAEDEFSQSSVFTKMIVSCPARSFYREGVPLGPIEYGDHVGAMLWRQSITFETTREPGDNTPKTSKFLPGFSAADRNAGYFYPESPQLNGQDTPLVFDTVSYTSDPGQSIQGSPPDPSAVAEALAGSS